MCGINGFISKHVISNAYERINKMNSSLAHRGPDAEGVEILYDGRIALGQRRLAIVDLDPRSNQPLCSADRMSILTFNGEIYNYKELKNKLHYDFTTESDTEVLLAGLREKGIDFVEDCNGMFAFSYYDVRNRKMTIVRDRMGIKPLYYYNDGEVFIFSSEIKGILNSGLVKARFNYDAIDEYLGNRYIREPYTFFENIYQLPAGTYMTISDRLDMEIHTYWALPDSFNSDLEYCEDAIYEKFKSEVANAVERRMIADVPVGAYLSGGIDSSIVSAIMSMKSSKAVNTYTIGFSELNEFEYARKVADKYNTNHHEITMSETDYFKMMEEIIQYKDAPLGVPNEIPLAQMSKELKKDITVVLSGEGADELMGGYGRIFRTPFDYKNVDSGIDADFYDYFINQYEYVPRKIRDEYLTCGCSLRQQFDEIERKSFLKHSDEENVFRFFYNYHIKGLLQRVDITTMYASVEARVPFLDYELVEFCYTKVPYSLKLRWNSEKDMNNAKRIHSKEYSEVLDKPKYLMRKYGLELLPEDVVTRKKIGFPVPLDKWFPDIEKLAKNLLGKSSWLKTDMIDKLCKDCKENQRSGQLLWMFVNIEIFRRLYFEKEWTY